MTTLATASPVVREFLALQEFGNNEVCRATFSEALKVTNKPHNRFNYIVPFDGNIPRFKLGPKGVVSYYNASLIGDGLAIATQGPSADSLSRFYAMIEQQGVTTIVSLSDPKASTMVDYWSGAARPKRYGIGDSRVEKRSFDLNGREITHYHLTNWQKDESLPVDVLVALIKKVEKVSGPLLVHCEAGVGRTGTFLAAYEAYVDQNPNLLEIAKRNRSYDMGRMSMIQTPVQYQLAHEACATLVSESFPTSA